MPNTREKLIELLYTLNLPSECDDDYEWMADRLIANGVTILTVPESKTINIKLPKEIVVQSYGSKWIPVSERLPEVVDSYIVAIKSKYDWEKDYTYDVDVATYNPYEKAYIDDCWNTYIDWDEGQQYLHVTHWMPLPEAPKGE